MDGDMEQKSSMKIVDCVLWPVRVEVNVQGFHVNVQGWEWETQSHKCGEPPTTGRQTVGLVHGISECSWWCARGRARSPSPWPQFPTVTPPSVDGGYAGHLASCLAAPQHGGESSQIHQGNPERKRENAQSGTKVLTEAEGEAQDKGYSGLREQSWN